MRARKRRNKRIKKKKRKTTGNIDDRKIEEGVPTDRQGRRDRERERKVEEHEYRTKV